MADTYVIAEVGTGHGGDITRAAELIAAARECGADCAKFQYVIADEIVHAATGCVMLPGGATALHERFRSLEQPLEFYEKLKQACDSTGIDFLCTPFGVGSARALRRIAPDAVKIASPELNHTQLLHELATYGLPLIVSSGVSTLSDIEYALSILGRSRVTLLHCITAYPAPEDEYNLNLIPALGRVLGIPVGVSDHSQDEHLVPGIATALGATVVEKHFTLSREGNGLDDSIAMDPAMFSRMVATIRRVDAIVLLEPDTGAHRAIGEFTREYGTERVAKVMGDGVKRLAPREAASYRTSRRSLLAVRDLPEDSVIRETDIAALRSETLAPGLEPKYADVVVGARLRRPLRSAEAITWTHLLQPQRRQ